MQLSEQQLLKFRLKMEELITRREGMMAENDYRINGGFGSAHRDRAFIGLADELKSLRESLIKCEKD